jgi:hypothetical protein
MFQGFKFQGFITPLNSIGKEILVLFFLISFSFYTPLSFGHLPFERGEPLDFNFTKADFPYFLFPYFLFLILTHKP